MERSAKAVCAPSVALGLELEVHQEPARLQDEFRGVRHPCGESGGGASERRRAELFYRTLCSGTSVGPAGLPGDPESSLHRPSAQVEFLRNNPGHGIKSQQIWGDALAVACRQRGQDTLSGGCRPSAGTDVREVSFPRSVLEASSEAPRPQSEKCGVHRQQTQLPRLLTSTASPLLRAQMDRHAESLSEGVAAGEWVFQTLPPALS